MAGVLKVDTIAENTSANGVAIEGNTFKDETMSALRKFEVLTGATDAITVSNGAVVIARAGNVNAATLALPSAAQDGLELIITTGTAYAHTITFATTGLKDGTTGTHNLATFGAFEGASLWLVAYNALWHCIGKNACTLS